MTLVFDIPAARASALTALDPRWKLVALVPAAFLVALMRSPAPALSAFVGALLLVQLARLPWPWVARRLAWTALFMALFLIWLPLLPDPGGEVIDVGWLRVSLTGLERFGAVLFKTLAIVTLFLVLLATAPLYDTLKAARSLHVPGVFVQLVLLTFRYVFLLAEEFVRLRTALRVRGYKNRADLHSWRTVGQVAGTLLLVGGHERAERVNQAMRCRGFDGTYHTLHDFETRGGDVVFAALVLAAAGGLLAWDLWLRRL